MRRSRSWKRGSERSGHRLVPVWLHAAVGESPKHLESRAVVELTENAISLDKIQIGIRVCKSLTPRRYPLPLCKAASLLQAREEVNMAKSKKLHVITDNLRRKTDKAFAQIKAAQKDLDLRIKQLKDELMAHTFRVPR